MTDSLDAFRDLACRALEAPADATLRTEIAEALTAHPEWAGEWRALRETHQLAQAAVPAALARAQADRAAAIPARRLDTLLRKKRTASRLRRALPLIGALAVCALFGILLFRPAPPDLSRWTQHAPASLARALTAPLDEVIATATLPTLRDTTTVQLRSPLLAAQAGPVTIAWADAATTPLTITLRDNGRVIWISPRVSAQIDTPPLEADRVYEVVLTPESGPTIREHFVTVPTAPTEHAGLEKILSAATAEPARLGEAVLAWHELPKELRTSEMGRRIGAWLGVEARQADMLAQVHAR
ncbi:MAG: hypothetical protein IT582_06255 [Opitutaceae bacterium]|nr:hypothetical protein [Opitutaceae bacterium]